jgi:transcription antitermination factor NusG
MEQSGARVLDRIRIVDGHFKGLTGAVVRISPGRVFVRVDIPKAVCGPAIVELRATQIELEQDPRPEGPNI